jgi:hypothetical protein
MGGSQRATAGRKRSATIAVGYVRVSTEEQVLGPEAQRVALARWAEGRGLQLVVVHEDRGVSGAAALDRRPGLLAALRVGYVVASAPVIERLVVLRSAPDLQGDAAIEAAVAELLEDGEVQRHVRPVRCGGRQPAASRPGRSC